MKKLALALIVAVPLALLIWTAHLILSAPSYDWNVNASPPARRRRGPGAITCIGKQPTPSLGPSSWAIWHGWPSSGAHKSRPPSEPAARFPTIEEELPVPHPFELSSGEWVGNHQSQSTHAYRQRTSIIRANLLRPSLFALRHLPPDVRPSRLSLAGFRSGAPAVSSRNNTATQPHVLVVLEVSCVPPMIPIGRLSDAVPWDPYLA